MAFINEMKLPLVSQTYDYTCGAACFASMMLFLRGEASGEHYFARELGTFDLGYTLPEKIVELAHHLEFCVNFKKKSNILELTEQIKLQNVVFVTWWFEDSGHYSLVMGISETQIKLMDPWEAREGKELLMPIKQFNQHWQSRGGVFIAVINPAESK